MNICPDIFLVINGSFILLILHRRPFILPPSNFNAAYLILKFSKLFSEPLFPETTISKPNYRISLVTSMEISFERLKLFLHWQSVLDFSSHRVAM